MLANRGSLASNSLDDANSLQSDDSVSTSLSGLDIGQQSQPPDGGNLPVNWQDLVDRIQRGDESGMEDLYRLFGRGIRYYLCRQLGHQELDDKVHDTFVIVV